MVVNAINNAFQQGDRLTSQIGFGRVPGLDALQRSTSQVGFGSALGSGQQMGGSTPIGQGQVPGSIRGEARPIGGYDDFMDGTYAAYMQRVQNEWNELMGQVSQGPPGTQGGITSLGGDWAGVDRWNQEILAASSRYGVPANLIKAVMKLESGGNPGSVSVAGAQGLMQIMPMWNGSDGWNINDPAQNVMLGAYVLKNGYDQYGDWDTAIRAYLGFGVDAYGTSDAAYLNRVSQDWRMLDASGSGANMAYGPSQGGGVSGSAMTSMFPSGQLHDWGYFGANSGNGLYGYGTYYGLNGTQHTGIDVAMPIGSAYYAPMGGTVTCAGTGNGGGTDGGGCEAFGSPLAGGPTSGRIEIQMDNGAILIFGHSQRAAVRVGQRVNAGTLLGYSGGMVSPHIHLEARVRDSSKPSGWAIVDPAQVLGGGFTPQPGAGSPQQGGSGFQQPMSTNQIMLNLMLGRPVAGY